MKRSPLLSVAMPPHTHFGISVAEIHLNQLLALIPAAAGGVLLWGLPGLRTLLLAVGTTVVLEWLTGRMMKRETSVLDGSALVQGLMLGMLLHAAAPWWLVLIGALLLVVLAKQFFGGQGGYLLQPVLLTYAILLISWPGQLNTAWRLGGLATAAQPIEPLLAWRSFGPGAANAYPLGDLLLGLQTGGVASGMIGLLTLGGIYLVIRGFIAWRIPLAFLGMAFVAALALHLGDATTYAPPGLHLFSGMLVFAAFFMATDFSCAPVNPWAQVIFGASCGLLAILIRTFGSYPDGTVFAVLLMNLAQPLIDRVHPPVIGVEVASR